MITYQTYNEIRFLMEHKGLSCDCIAHQLHLDLRTVIKWTLREHYEPRKATIRSSILDPYKEIIRRDLVLGACTTSFIFNRLRQEGYTGGQTILKSYLKGLRCKRSNLSDRFILPNEWMLKLVQGKLTVSAFAEDFCNPIRKDDINILLQRICNGSLKVRNQAAAILSYIKNISQLNIARFLHINLKTVGLCVRKYKEGGIAGLNKSSSGKQRMHEQEKYKAAVFGLLHSPPASHGINRTSWRMDDLKQVLHLQGIAINKDSIRRIIKDAGYRFRTAKRVLTSTDPEYREKLAELTRTLSSLTASQRFFSIDEFGPFSVKIQGGRSLVGPGQERIVPQWQKSKGSLILIGALELATNQITHFYAQQKNTSEMIKLLHILLDQYHDLSLLYFSWDAASWHASKAFLAEVASLNESDYRISNHSPAIALVPLPASAQFLNVIESVFSGMARAIIHNSDYASVEACKEAIDKYILERNDFYQKHPKRAGDKIWGRERVPPVFSPNNNCKDPYYR